LASEEIKIWVIGPRPKKIVHHCHKLL